MQRCRLDVLQVATIGDESESAASDIACSSGAVPERPFLLDRNAESSGYQVSDIGSLLGVVG